MKVKIFQNDYEMRQHLRIEMSKQTRRVVLLRRLIIWDFYCFFFLFIEISLILECSVGVLSLKLNDILEIQIGFLI